MAKETLIIGRYPITPTELGGGYVKGSDRLLTSRSGTFGFEGTGTGAAGVTHAQCACLELFDRGAGFVRRWQVPSSASFDVVVQEGETVVATPTCARCSS